MGAVSILPGYTNQQLAELQGEDPILSKVVALWMKGRRLARTELQNMPVVVCRWYSKWVQFVCIDNVLYIECFENGEGTLQLALPTSLRQPVLEALHDGSGQQGRDRTLALVRKRAFWPGMSKDVDSYCISCSRCYTAEALRPKV